MNLATCTTTSTAGAPLTGGHARFDTTAEKLSASHSALIASLELCRKRIPSEWKDRLSARSLTVEEFQVAMNMLEENPNEEPGEEQAIAAAPLSEEAPGMERAIDAAPLLHGTLGEEHTISAASLPGEALGEKQDTDAAPLPGEVLGEPLGEEQAAIAAPLPGEVLGEEHAITTAPLPGEALGEALDEVLHRRYPAKKIKIQRRCWVH